MHSRKLMILLAVLALVLAACGNETASPSGSGGGGTSSRDMTIEVVTHGQASDPFWSVVKNGVDQAGTDLGITVHYSAPETFDMNRTFLLTVPPADPACVAAGGSFPQSQS